MATTIAVVPEGKKFKVLINYIQEGIAYPTARFANQEATKLSETRPTDHLILYKE
jgi:hypothetical protein